jgi:hypothetical protein
MNHNNTRWLGLLLFAFLSSSIAETPVEPETPTEKTSAPAAVKVNPERAQCLKYCDTVEGQCSSEVRRARSECSKHAASQGRDPMTMRNDDYAYFCNYFGNGNACGSGIYSGACRARFSSRYGLCVSAIQDSVASMRYDCFQTERKAQGYCRDELFECRSSCPK